MPQIINTNISSLNSQRHLNNTQSSLSTALERLSSGKRINSAKDDAAGLGIASRMTTQVNGMNQAIRNARDGISLSQTAEGALATSGDMLQRIRTLAVQSSNASNSSLDRQASQDEVGQLVSELNRIANTTSFNGQKLLDGTMGAQNFQVGANAGEIITANGMNFKTDVYGTNRIQANAALSVAGVAAAAFAGTTSGFTSQDITINGPLGSAKTGASIAASATARGTTAQEMAALVNVQSDKTGVTATAKTEVLFNAKAAGSFSYLLASENKDADAVTISFAVSGAFSTADDYAAAINAFNAQSSKTGVTAEYDSTNKGIKLVNANGNDINMASQLADATVSTLTTYKADKTLNTAVNLAAAVPATPLMTTVYTKGVVTFDATQSFSLSQTGAALDAFGITDATAAATSTAGASKLKSVAELDVSTFDGAQLALAIVDAAINTVNKEMARYGALQARFDATISNLEVNVENTSNARSRIQDADYAQETAALSRASILQQAGTAMLAQANQMPQTVLSLIG